MVIHNTVNNNIYFTRFFEFIQKRNKQFFVIRVFQDWFFVVTTVVYVVKTVCFEVPNGSRHDKRIADGGEFLMKWGQRWV